MDFFFLVLCSELGLGLAEGVSLQKALVEHLSLQLCKPYRSACMLPGTA